MAEGVTLATLVAELADALLARQWLCVTAESCTGGGIARALTDQAGSSGWFDRGFVTYSNEAKQEMLGVPVETIERCGAVSEQTARAMAEGALSHSRAHVAVAVTGIAGPTGGMPDKPVGTVAFAWAVRGDETRATMVHIPGDRGTVRETSIGKAVEGLLDRLRRP